MKHRKLYNIAFVLPVLLCFCGTGSSVPLPITSISNIMTDNRTALVAHVEFAAQMPDSAEIEKAFKKVPSYPVDVVNWPDKNGSYSPIASFQVIYSDTELYIRYSVKEKTLKALFDYDETSKPWTDDCMELFILPNPADSIYFNIEMNCTGWGIIGKGTGKKDRTRVPAVQMERVRRFCSLGREPFGIKQVTGEDEFFEWHMIIAIPLDILTQGKGVELLRGKSIKANVFKCGDEMPQRHYLTWNPVKTERPDYHRPEFFGTFKFE